MRTILANLRYRWERTTALVLAIAVATGCFTMLSSTVTTQQLEATGTVADNFRPIYDVLVRPKGTQLPLERSSGLVQPATLSATQGGISLEQWQRIRRVPGVEVAAPIAVVGFVMPQIHIPVNLAPYLNGPAGDHVLRIDLTWASDAGLSRARDGTIYLYRTDKPLDWDNDEHHAVLTRDDGTRVGVCSVPTWYEGDPVPQTRDVVVCVTSNKRHAGNTLPTTSSVTLEWPFPYCIVAVDPAQEDALANLKAAVVSGRPLGNDDGPQTVRSTLQDQQSYPQGPDGWTTHGHAIDPRSPIEYRSVPVLLAAHAGIEERLDIAVSDLGSAGVAAVTSGASEPDLVKTLPGMASRLLGTRSVSADDAYAGVKKQLSSPRLQDSIVDRIYRVGAVGWTPGSVPAAVPLAAPPRTSGTSDAEDRRPLEFDDTAFRDITVHDLNVTVDPDETVKDVQGDTTMEFPAYHTTWRTKGAVLNVLGTFDATRIPLGSPLSRVPMDIYSPVTATAGDDAARRVLGDHVMAPGNDIAGLLAQPASMITTLKALPLFQEYGNQTAAEKEFPISVVRVRVAGSLGLDAASRERVNLAAQQIREATGLDVDVTVGASPTPQAVAVPAGKFGRPALVLHESWVKKGVALVVTAAVDRKSLLLFSLILFVCAMFVANAGAATVRGRTSEIGVLACLGWSRRRLTANLVGEVAIVGLMAGLAGSAGAVPVARLVGIDLSVAHAALGVPAAVVLTVVVAMWPAWRGANATPLVALRPTVASARRASSPRTVLALAAANVVRRPGRALLGAASLAVGICALLLLLVIDLGFHGAVVGTVLGDALALRARHVDYVAAIATTVMGGMCITDVLYVNVRERAAEFTVLRLSGWPESVLLRLLAYEGLAIGGVGVLAGVGGGLALARALIGPLPAACLRVALVAGGCGLAVTLLAVAAPALTMRRLPMSELLADE